MNTQVDWKVVEDFEDAIEKARRNGTCLYPGCKDKPIGSHVIARKTLKLIDDNGHVLAWKSFDTSLWDMVRTVDAGKPLEQLNEEPVRVSIEKVNNVKYPLFCRNHDDRIFAPLEKKEFSFQPEQVVLLAFRALCSMIFRTSAIDAIFTAVAQQQSYPHSLRLQESLQKLQRFLTTDLVLKARQLYAQTLSAHDYNQLGWSAHLVNIPPCIAATYSLIPIDSNEALTNIIRSPAFTIEDAVSFSFLPYKPMNNSICVISWLRGSQRAQWFMNLHKINELSEKAQQDLFLTFAFESPMLYISPAWWQSLSDEKREEYAKIHLKAGREHAQLV